MRISKVPPESADSIQKKFAVVLIKEDAGLNLKAGASTRMDLQPVWAAFCQKGDIWRRRAMMGGIFSMTNSISSAVV